MGSKLTGSCLFTATCFLHSSLSRGELLIVSSISTYLSNDACNEGVLGRPLTNNPAWKIDYIIHQKSNVDNNHNNFKWKIVRHGSSQQFCTKHKAAPMIEYMYVDTVINNSWFNHPHSIPMLLRSYDALMLIEPPYYSTWLFSYVPYVRLYVKEELETFCLSPLGQIDLFTLFICNFQALSSYSLRTGASKILKTLTLTN